MLLKTLFEIRELFSGQDRRQWKGLLLSSVAVGMARGLVLAMANEAVAAYSRGEPYRHFAAAMAVLLAIAVFGGHFNAMRGQLVSTRLAIRLRNQISRRIGGAALDQIDQQGSERLHWHLMSNATELAYAYESLLKFVTATVMLLFTLAYVGWLSLSGLAFALAISIVGVAVHMHQEKLNREPRERRVRLWSEAWSAYRELLDGFKELRLARAKREQFLGEIELINDRIRDAELAETRNISIGARTTYVFQVLVIAGVVFGLPLVAPVDGITLLQLLAALATSFAPLEGVVDALPPLFRARVALVNLRALEADLDRRREVEPALAASSIAPMRSIEMRAVEFEFAPRDGVSGFHLGPIDLELRAGEVTFVCGGNGSGKTVLMRVLSGLYQPTAGEIRFNGQPLDAASMQGYREQFATVFSDFHVFSTLLGPARQREGEVAALLEHYALAGRARYRDGRFDTQALSTGQRKRLALLVATLDERPIFLLDEFGADQDPVNRQRFYDEWMPALKAAGKTILVVSHDDAYFDRCDQMVKLDFGRISAHSRRTSA